ncbi:MAG TPA: hypothetical protein VF495_16405 [Phenylobacterium sp.]
MPTGPIPIVMGAWLAPVLLAGLLVWRMMSARRERDRQALAAAPTPDEAGITEFPVRGVATRGGFLGGNYSQNSLNPHFWVARDAVRIRILKEWRLPFVDLTQVDARKTMGGMALIFHIEAENRVFIVRFGDPALARAALSLVVSSVPFTEEAAVLRDGHARAATRGLPRYTGRLG